MTTKIYYVVKVTECGRQRRSDIMFERSCHTYSAGVMGIRIARSSCRRPQLLFDQIYLFIVTLGCDTAFLRIVKFGL